MKMLPKKINLFYIAYSLYFLNLFTCEIEGLEFNATLKILKYISYIILIAHLLLRSYRCKRRELNYIVFFAVFALIYSVVTRERYFITTLLLILASEKEDRDEILRYSYTLLLSGIVIVVILAITGILKNESTPRHYGGDTRLTFGFHHSNVLPLMAFYLFSWMLIVKKYLSYVEIMFMTVCTIVIDILCDSRNGLVLCCVLIVIAVFQKIKANTLENGKESKLFRLLCRYSILWCTLFSMGTLFLYFMYTDKFNMLSSSTLVARLELASRQIQNSGLHLVNMISRDVYTSSSLPLDNGYHYIVIRFGVLFILFFTQIQKKIYDQHDRLLSIVFALTTVGCMIDNDFFTYGFIPYVLIAYSNGADATNRMQTFRPTNTGLLYEEASGTYSRDGAPSYSR